MPPKELASAKSNVPAAAMLAGLAVIVGVVVFSYGCWLAWRPLGFIAGGLSMIAVGVLMGRNAARRRS